MFAVFFAAFCLLSSSETLAQAQADLAVMKSAPEFVSAGNNFNYTITVSNFGPNSAINVSLTDALPGDLTFVSLTQNSGPAFNCTTPGIGAGGTVTCTSANFTGSTSAQFTLTVNVSNGTPVGTSYTNIATVTSETFDPNDENNSSPTTTTVMAPSAASVSLTGRVLAANGRGVRGVIVRLVDEQGKHRIAMTSTFGYYRFVDIPAGQTYIIGVSAKKYTFTQSSQVLNLTGDTGDINFVADN
ncbi:MAG: carboxypeptidase regulatory-like domain-containing protein [Acidobacteriota bacterium]|nr:carboxypeptidase regulatory-like domain-containing protein [Acidobacteriota bacterium]